MRCWSSVISANPQHILPHGSVFLVELVETLLESAERMRGVPDKLIIMTCIILVKLSGWK